jgi:hypothetical protein
MKEAAAGTEKHREDTGFKNSQRKRKASKVLQLPFSYRSICCLFCVVL